MGLKNLIINLFFKEEMKASRLYLLISFLLSFTLLFYSSIAFSCQLSLIQNLVLPFFIVQNVQSFYNLKNPYDKLKVGSILGVIAGIIPAITLIIISTIRFYLLGNRFIAYSAFGKNPPEISLEILYLEIGSQVVMGILLVFLSALSGVISSLIVRKKIPQSR